MTTQALFPARENVLGLGLVWNALCAFRGFKRPMKEPSILSRKHMLVGVLRLDAVLGGGMSKEHRCRIAFWLFVWVVLGRQPALAVTDEEVFRDFRFNFINPGGRSLGMGGAFISVAADATAAQANPAGLTNLLTPQVFVEIRSASVDDSSVHRDFADSLAPYSLDVDTSQDPVTNPSFLSYVIPHGSMAFALSRQELLNTRSTAENTYQVSFGDAFDLQQGRGTIDMELVNWNASVAWRVHDRFQIGLTGSAGTLTVRSNVLNTYTNPDGKIVPELGGVPITLFTSSTDDTDSELTWTVGFQWCVVRGHAGTPVSSTTADGQASTIQLPGRHASTAQEPVFGLAGVYRLGGDFAVQETVIGTFIDPALRPGEIVSRLFFNETDELLRPGNTMFPFKNRFHIPDVAGVGLFWRPARVLTVAMDAQHVTYSNLLDGYNSRLNVLTVGWETEEEAAFTVDDQTNVHVGVEYVFADVREGLSLAFRAGAHQDKDSRLRSDFAPGGFGLAENANFPPGRDHTHFSLGLGIVAGEGFQVDIGVDGSEESTEAVVSMILKFGGRAQQ